MTLDWSVSSVITLGDGSHKREAENENHRKMVRGQRQRSENSEDAVLRSPKAQERLSLLGEPSMSLPGDL